MTEVKEKRTEPIFWVENNCPKCGYVGDIIYLPSLLDKPVTAMCASAHNEDVDRCDYYWTIDANGESKERIESTLKVAEEYDKLKAFLYQKVKVSY